MLSLAYTYNEDDSRLIANVANDSETINLFEGNKVVGYNGCGRISWGSNLTGAMHEVTLWNNAQSFIVAQEGMHTAKMATTPNLMGYWNLNGGYWTVTEDLVRKRQRILRSSDRVG